MFAMPRRLSFRRTRLPLQAPALCTALALLAAGASRAAEPRPHVLLLSVDTLRADALGCYGFGADTTPHLDRLAESGVLFEDALTTIGKTGPAFASLFSSLYPPTHGARRNGVPMRSDVPVLAELLREAGYQTAAFISNWTLRSNLAATNRGFDHYDEEFDRKRHLFGSAERSAEAVTESVFEWLSSARDPKRPLFLWVHYSEPHTPYDRHDGFILPQPERGQGALKRWRYASEVAFTDHWVGRLLEGLEGQMPEKQRLTIFVGDHGESLGEHGYWGHGKNAHWPNLRIPLILSGPTVPADRRLSEPASILDVMPTVLELLSLRSPKGIAGESLVAGWRGAFPNERARFVLADRHAVLGKKGRENYDNPLQIGFVRAGVKTIFDFEKRQTLYFDLREDPAESRPLQECPIESRPPCRRLLANWYRELPKYDSAGGELSEEDLRQLKSLGYVGGR